MFLKILAETLNIKQKIIQATTFDQRICQTVKLINKYLDKDITKMHLFFDGHVGGIKNLVYSKPVEMCILYKAVTSSNPNLRLMALDRLQAEIINYESLEMPMNTRRVLMVLTKEIVKARGNHELQCRLVSRFYEALSGRATIIRSLLDSLAMPEVPEPDIYKEKKYDFKKYYTAWDDQMYDNLSSGRKTPSQLLIEFYSKGGSKGTIIYDNFKEMTVISEALAAAELLEIDLTLGIECLIRDDQNPDALPYYQVIIFENCKTLADYYLLLKDPNFLELQKMVQESLQHRRQSYYTLVENFNQQMLPQINTGYAVDAAKLQPLKIEELEEYAQGRQLHYVHLGRFLQRQITNPEHNIKAYRQQLLKEDPLLYNQVQENFTNTDEEYLRKRYFPINACDLNGHGCLSFKDLQSVLQKIKVNGSNGQSLQPRMILTRPLRNGFKSAVEFILKNYQHIDALEIWNNQAYESDGEAYQNATLRLNQFREWLNAGNILELQKLFSKENLILPRKQLKKIIEHFSKFPLLARINSCADNQNPKAVGKCFVLTDKIKRWKLITKKNKTDILKFRIASESELHNPLGILKVESTEKNGNILPLGRKNGGSRYAVEANYWQDLNHDLKNIIKISFAFLSVLSIYLIFPAFAYGPLILGIWFCITYGRNFIVDMLSKGFSLVHFDRHNAADSIFFSYYSIPLLKTFEHFLSLYVLGGENQDINRAIRFFSLALLNGIYIASHNTLRGFNNKTRLANFFRTVMAFPLALGFTYILDEAGFDYSDYAVLINKCASDTVGGIVEGIAKRYAAIKRTQRIMIELVTKVMRTKFRRIDVLDLLYVWKHYPKGKAVARKILLSKDFSLQKFKPMLNFLEHQNSYRHYITNEQNWIRSGKIVKAFESMISDYRTWIKRMYVFKKILNAIFFRNNRSPA